MNLSAEVPTVSAFVAEKLKNYVYLYVHPRTKEVFYVGKGTGTRMLDHLDEAPNKQVARVLRELKREGLAPRIDILKHGLNDQQAKHLEAAAIDLFGVEKLANKVRGHGSATAGRQELGDLVRAYERKEAVIEVPTILIRIHKTYRPGMSGQALYEYTRGFWSVDIERARRAKYALAVFKGAVMEAYKLAECADGGSAWFKAGTTAYFERADEITGTGLRGLWEFVGTPVTGSLRSKLLGRVPRGYGGGIEYFPE